MVKITRVYTKNGDKGQTKLARNRPIDKNSLRIICIGDLDELNCNIGFAIESLKLNTVLIPIAQICTRIQHELFSVGTQLAVLSTDRKKGTPKITTQHVTQLEIEIDTINKNIPPLNSFVLPGGCESAARIHMARSVCRRAERNIHSLNQSLEIALEEEIMMYMNRLSDLLFVLARYSVKKTDSREILWDYGISDKM